MIGKSLDSNIISNLAVLIKESYRSTESGVKRFIEPAAGTLMQSTSKTHSIVFGRRGSGKSSLLRKAAQDLTVDRRPIAYVDLETFKGHSYPDVLLSVLIQTFNEFEEWLRTAAIYSANKTSFWQKFFGKAPQRPSFNKKDAENLAEVLKEKRDELNQLLHSSDNVNIHKTTKSEAKSTIEAEIGAGINSPIAQIKSSISDKDDLSLSEETNESYQSNKIEFLHRHILEYQEIFRIMSGISDGDSFLFLDDLYYLKRSDQARVIDYFHRVGKGNKLWLKIGTVRHRSTWYIHGDPPYGLKLGDDAHEINLDLTLENYSTTKSFLVKILQSFFDDVKIEIKDLLVDEAIDRLVLASGGVARDFLGIFDRSIMVVQERGIDYRGSRIGKEDVNIAAGRYSSTKMDEFKNDILNDNEHISLEDAFRKIKHFCINRAKTNLFLVDRMDENGKTIIEELMDLRLVHKVSSHETVSKKQGQVFEVYMLDVSAYAEMRKKRGFDEIMFWGKARNQRIRRITLVLNPNYLTSNVSIEELDKLILVDEDENTAEENNDDGDDREKQLELF